MANRFTVSEMSETSVLWCCFRDQKEIPAKMIFRVDEGFA